MSKQQYSTVNVTIEINVLVGIESREVGLVIEKGDVGETILYIYRLSGGGLELAASYVNSGTNPRDPGRNSRFFNLTDVFRDLEVVRPPIDRPLVLAFYYPWYGSPYGPTGQWVHWNHWIMNTSDGSIIGYHGPDKFVGEGLRDIGDAHYPLLGP